MSEEEKRQALVNTDLVNWTVFSEILSMDEDEEGFSKNLIETFVEQAIGTFNEINENLSSNFNSIELIDFEKISSLGHYLKGSAAALGFKTIQSECERIQNYGVKLNFDNFDINESNDSDKADNTPIAVDESSDEYWLKMIEDALFNARNEFIKTKEALEAYFGEEL